LLLKRFILNDEGTEVIIPYPETQEEIQKVIEESKKKFKDIFIFKEEEERNDVYIYKTLQYPPKSTPPTAT